MRIRGLLRLGVGEDAEELAEELADCAVAEGLCAEVKGPTLAGVVGKFDVGAKGHQDERADDEGDGFAGGGRGDGDRASYERLVLIREVKQSGAGQRAGGGVEFGGDRGVKANVLFFERKPASATPWTRTLWIYDLRTNMHFTLKQNALRYEHLQDFIAAYQAENRGKRSEGERFKAFTYDELMQRDKVSLDLIWLRDESLEDSAHLPPPDVLAQEIVEDLEAALSEFAQIAQSLRTVEEA